MKNKTTTWTAEEDAVLVQGAANNISAERLSVRLRRSVGSIKRRMRQLQLVGRARISEEPGPAQVELVRQWIRSCQQGDLFALLRLYAPSATLECACSGQAVYAGLAIAEYWQPKLESRHPHRFTLESARVQRDRVTIDYLSYEAKPVRMFLDIDADGKISHSACGPRGSLMVAA
jgi:hypothetical protein